MLDVDLPAEVEELRAAAERLARAELQPEVRQAEAAGRWSDHVVSVLSGFPLSGLDLPVERGGAGGGCLAKVVLLETLAWGDASGLPAADPLGLVAGALIACPAADLVAMVVDSCQRGSAQCTFTVTEPGHRGEGPAWAPGWPALRWIWEVEGDRLCLHELTVPARPVTALAFQASGGVGVPWGDTVARGEWHLAPRAAREVSGRARLWAAAVAVGIAQAALEETIQYTTERVVFGKPVAHHQGNAFELAAAAARVHGARLVVRDAASSFDAGDPDAGFWATQAWLETMDAAFRATDAGIQLLGGHGFIADHLAEKRFREARMLALLAGGRDGAEFDVAADVTQIGDLVGGSPGRDGG